MTVTYTRRPIAGRIKARLRCVYLRWLIDHAERDLKRHQMEFEDASRRLPKQIDLDRTHIQELTVLLMQADRNK